MHFSVAPVYSHADRLVAILALLFCDEKEILFERRRAKTAIGAIGAETRPKTTISALKSTLLPLPLVRQMKDPMICTISQENLAEIDFSSFQRLNN